MKVTLIFLFVLSIAGSSASPVDFSKATFLEMVRGHCRLTTKVNEELVEQVRNWNFTSQDPALKKYSFCVYRTLTLVDDKGDFDIEHAVKLLPSSTDPAKFRTAIGVCRNMQGCDVYDRTYKILSCYNVLYPKDISAL